MSNVLSKNIVYEYSHYSFLKERSIINDVISLILSLLFSISRKSRLGNVINAIISTLWYATMV